MLRILIDMDNTLSDLEGGFLKKWIENYPDKPFIPLEERTTFHIIEQYSEALKPLVAKIGLSPGFFRNLEPVRGGIEALHTMRGMGFEVYICSSPLSNYRNCVSEKYEWVEEHLGSDWVKCLILTKDKTIIKASILIDDKPIIRGAENLPNWEHIIYDQPYNKNVVGKRRLTWKNWKTILFSESVRV